MESVFVGCFEKVPGGVLGKLEPTYFSKTGGIRRLCGWGIVEGKNMFLGIRSMSLREYFQSGAQKAAKKILVAPESSSYRVTAVFRKTDDSEIGYATEVRATLKALPVSALKEKLLA